MEEILQHALALTGLTDQDAQTLKQAAPKTLAWTDLIVKEFYDTLFGYAPSASVFSGPDERPAREQTLRDWYEMVAKGEIDERFWRHMWLVGLVHIKRGVSNTFMLAMVSRVQTLFLRQCLKEFDLAQAEKVYTAFKRVFDVVAVLIAEGYFTNYVEGLEHVFGFKRALSQRMLLMEINRKLDELRAKQ